MEKEGSEYEVYVLRSVRDGKRYIGISTTSKERVRSHNWGRTKSTKARRPFVIVYVESAANRREARSREKYLKSAAEDDSSTKSNQRSHNFKNQLMRL